MRRVWWGFDRVLPSDKRDVDTCAVQRALHPHPPPHPRTLLGSAAASTFSTDEIYSLLLLALSGERRFECAALLLTHSRLAHRRSAAETQSLTPLV